MNTTNNAAAKTAEINVTRYAADKQTWILVGDADTDWDEAYRIALNHAKDGERLVRDGRDDDCGGCLFRVAQS